MLDDATQNIKTVLGAISTYGGTPTVELERVVLEINNRYPYIEISGPYIDVYPQFTNVDVETAEYNILYFVNYNDEDQTEDEITYVTRNVAGEIWGALMADVTRGGNVINTSIKNWGNSFELVDGRNEFLVYVIIECTLRTDSTDPALVG